MKKQDKLHCDYIDALIDFAEDMSDQGFIGFLTYTHKRKWSVWSCYIEE